VSSAQPVRLGIVGCGFVAEHRHLPTLARMSEIDVVAVADIDTERCRRVADRFGIANRDADVAALLERPEVEAVAVCVPAAEHAQVALAALDAGKHVFVEKPLALSLDEADALVERARSAGTTAVVGFNLRSHTIVREARKLIRQGLIGRVTAVETSFSDERLTMPDLPSWRTKRELGGGALLEKVVHHVDLWRFLLGDEAQDVFGVASAEHADDDVVMVTGRMRAGTLVHAFASDLTALSNEVRIRGEEGALLLDLFRFDGLTHANLRDLPGAPATRVRGILATTRQLAGRLGEIRQGGVFDATYRAEWRNFAAAVRGLEAPACTLEDGRRALEIILAAARSASLGRPVTVGETPRAAPATREAAL
jgi:predicted dehydrogenase